MKMFHELSFIFKNTLVFPRLNVYAFHLYWVIASSTTLWNCAGSTFSYKLSRLNLGALYVARSYALAFFFFGIKLQIDPVLGKRL